MVSPSVGPTSWTDVGRPSGPGPHGTEAAGLPATFQRATYAMAGIDASAEPTVPLPPRIPTWGGRCAIVGVSSTSQSSKTRLAFTDTFSVCARAQSMTFGVTHEPIR